MQSNYNEIKEIIKSFSGQENIVGVPKPFIEFTDDLEGGVFLSQLVFFSDKGGRHDGWFYKTYQDWKDHIGMSEYKIRKWSKKFKEMGLLETRVRRAEGNPTVHYFFNMDRFLELFLEFLQERNQRKSRIETEESSESLTEITTENTTENCVLPHAESNDSVPLVKGLKPQTITIVDEEYLKEDCPSCGESIVLKNLRKSSAVCPHCFIGLYIKNQDGEIICQPPQHMRPHRKKNTLGDIMPDCPPRLADYVYYKRDEKRIKEMLSDKEKARMFLEALDWAVGKFAAGEMQERQIVANALSWSGRRANAAQQQPEQSQTNQSTLYETLAKQYDLPIDEIKKRLDAERQRIESE